MGKIYLQEDNSGYGIMITNGAGNWYYIDPYNGFVGDIDLYGQSPIETVRLLASEIDDTTSLLSDYGTVEYEIGAYRGLTTIDDVEKFEREHAKSIEDTIWYEIPLR